MTGTSTRKEDVPTTVERLTSIAAAVVTPLGLIVAGLLVPSGIDVVTSSDAYGIKKVLLTSEHATEIRLGYLALVAALLCIAPATRRVLALAGRGRGSLTTAIGWRLVAIGAAAGAIGNAFAPLILPSTVGSDPALMGAFVHRHESSAASLAIIAVYLLLPIGSAVLLVGLIRASALATWHAVLLSASLAVITPLRLGPQAVIDGVALGAALFLLHRRPS